MDANLVALGCGSAVVGARRILAAFAAEPDAGAMVATRDGVGLLTEYADGRCVVGTAPPGAHGRIRRVSLRPGRVRATPEAVAAIEAAEAIVLGPASLYSALMPTLLVRGIAAAIAASRAPVILVMNLLTEPGDTDGHDGTDIVLALRRHVPLLPVALTVVVNSSPLPELVARRYARAGRHPITVDARTLANLGCRVVHADLLAPGTVVRHDAAKLARTLAGLTERTYAS